MRLRSRAFKSLIEDKIGLKVSLIVIVAKTPRMSRKCEKKIMARQIRTKEFSIESMNYKTKHDAEML